MTTKEYGVEELLQKLEEMRIGLNDNADMSILGAPEYVTPALRLFIQRVGRIVCDRGLPADGAFAAGVMFGVRIGRTTDIKVFKNET
jgi:hypothetical protein